MRKIDSYEVNLLERTKRFASLAIRISSRLPRNPAGFAIASQLVRAATSIGANLIEAQEAISRRDFLYKISISLKEAKETRYWLELILSSNLLLPSEVTPILRENEEIVKILVTILKKLRSK